MSTKFESENRAFSFVFCALVSLSCLPVMGWHYWQTLDGLALLAIVGLLLCDSVLWFASHWATSASTGSLRACSLVVKFALAAVMLLNAAACVAILRSDRQATSAAEQSTAARVAEINARAAAARDLAATPGGRAAARELVRMPAAEQARVEVATLPSILPPWYAAYGVYSLPPIVALIGFMVLAICASIVKRSEQLAQLVPVERMPAQQQALVESPVWRSESPARPH